MIVLPITAAGTDFRTWKRENLERLATELTAEVIRLRGLMNNTKEQAMSLSWEFNGEGAWTAYSRLNDEGSQFQYTIAVCDDGTFDVSESDSELLGGTSKPECFPTLVAAKDWCQANETVVSFVL